MRSIFDVPLLAITTTKNCSVNCYPFCPQMKFRQIYGDREDFLSYEDFQLVLSHVPKNLMLGFEGFCEPFLNRRTMDMIELAKRDGHPIQLYSTLVGFRLEDVKRLRQANLDWFCLHLPDDQGVAHIPMTENYKEVLAEVLSTVTINDYARMDKAFVSNFRAGNCDDAPPHHVYGPFYCLKLIRPQLLMLPNCDAVLCCMDWGMKHVLGNLKEQTFDEIIHGPIYRKIAMERWKMDGSSLCRSCVQAWSLPKKAAYDLGRVGYLAAKRWIRFK